MANLKGNTTVGGYIVVTTGNYSGYALPISGGTIDGLLNIRPNTGNYSEGIRIASSGGWSNIQFGTDGTLSGNNPDGLQWLVGRHPSGYFMIVPGGQESGSNGLILNKNGNSTWYGNILLNASNYTAYSAFTTTISTSVSSSATAMLGVVSSSWGGNSTYPTLFSSSADRWVMHINPHISYVQSGVNGYTGTMTGATIRFAGNPTTSVTHWDIGVGVNGIGADNFSIGKGGTNFFNIRPGNGIQVQGYLDTLGPQYAYGGISVGNAGARAGALTGVNSIAIGDNDTGIRQNGDGVLEIFANGVLTSRYQNGSIELQGYTYINNAGRTAGTITMYSNDGGGGYNTRAIELREVGLSGAGPSGDPNYAPAIGFHWGGVNQTTLLMDTGGQLAIRSSGSTWGSRLLHAGNYTTYAIQQNDRTNWSSTGAISNVVGQLAWKNYGNNHTIFDASNGISPSGTSINNTNSDIRWSGAYPTLMGWNGANTYGVRVDSALNADNVNHANYADYLPTKYNGGQQTNPQVYFNNNIGLRVAMTGYPNVWSDTVWINGYSGGDVPDMCALHFIRNGQPRAWISSQNVNAGSYGTTYELISAYNISSQSVNYANSAGSAPNAGNSNSYYSVTPGDGNGIRFWTSTSYRISMGVGGLYQYGTVSDYSIKMNMDDGSTGRGFTWGRESYAPIASLNSYYGHMQIAGNMYASAFFASSDIRLKNIIKPKHKDVSNLKPITYTWKDETKDQTPQLGYSAQDVLELIPDAVNKDSDGLLSVNYIQVLIAQIESLTKRITELENKN